MSRPKLHDYAYYNFQLPAPEKARLQALAQTQGQTLSHLLLDYVQACDLLRKVAQEADEAEAKIHVRVWKDGDKAIVEYDKQVVKF